MGSDRHLCAVLTPKPDTLSTEEERALLMSPTSSNEFSDGNESSKHISAWKTQSSQRSVLAKSTCGYITTRIVIYSLFATLCITGTLCLVRKFSKRQENPSFAVHRPEWSPGEEINRLIPEFPRKAIQFWSDNSLALNTEIPTAERIEEINRNWKALMPPGGGLIHIENNERYLLPPGMNLKSSNTSLFWIISVYHQLHCLDGIRSALNQLYFDDITSPNNHEHVEHHEHIYHCLEYLRQIILCHGDTALEGTTDGLPGTSGWGTTHICKDYEAVQHFAKEKWRSIKTSLLRPATD